MTAVTEQLSSLGRLELLLKLYVTLAVFGDFLFRRLVKPQLAPAGTGVFWRRFLLFPGSSAATSTYGGL